MYLQMGGSIPGGSVNVSHEIYGGTIIIHVLI